MPEGRRVGNPGNRGNTNNWTDERREHLRETLKLKRKADYQDVQSGQQESGVTASVDLDWRQKRRQREYDDLRKAIYERAMNGDPQATKAWLDIYDQEAPTNAFNIEVSIEPYTVADTSLANIVRHADVPVVEEILKGFDQRLFAEEAPTELRNLLRVLREQFTIWAQTHYDMKG